jgi:NAD-dependent dihydropyrimidine dehydrogenase PreA subunit
MTAATMDILVDADVCTGCGGCVSNCPQRVFELQEGKACVVNSDDCLGCYLCEVSCESQAITIKEG